MITVVTITYNNLVGLNATAQSIRGQDFAGCEWIVIDGGSTDGSREFLDALDHCQYVSERDKGIYDAMRKGLALAKKPYVVFLNAGDEFATSSSLRSMIDAMSGHDVYFFGTRVEGLNRAYVRSARPLLSARYSVPSIQQSTVYRVAALRELEWPADYKVCGDYFLAAQILKKNWSWQARDVEASLFRLGGVSTFSVALLCREAWRVQRDVLALPLVIRLVHYLRRYLTGLLVLSGFRVSSNRARTE